MNDEEFRLLDEIEDGQWWFVGKRLILRTLLERHAPRGRVLDLGCGTGGILRDFMQLYPCYGADRSELALRICSEKGFDRLVRSDLGDLPFAAGAFDTILALDVIEHLQDDVDFLVKAGRLLAPGGRMLLSVPAFPILWSQHDVTFQHYRRYRAHDLRDVVERAGFVPERITHTNSLIFPAVFLWRVLSSRTGLGRYAPKHDFWEIPSWLNALLVWIYRLETRLLRVADLPVGVSVVCVARKEA
jgi:SAM-dependent methyltransferase